VIQALVFSLFATLFVRLYWLQVVAGEVYQGKAAAQSVRETAMNVVFDECFQRVYESIREGETIAQPLKESRLVDDMVVNMIDVGEETGDLDTMLNKIADFYDEEVDAAVSGLLAMMEPVMIVFLGVVVGGMVVSMYLPIFDIINAVQGLGQPTCDSLSVP
jgi:type IV pilus assembly protein PilC